MELLASPVPMEKTGHLTYSIFCTNDLHAELRIDSAQLCIGAASSCDAYRVRAAKEATMAFNLEITGTDLIATETVALIEKNMEYVFSILSHHLKISGQPLDIRIDIKPASENPTEFDGLMPSNPAWVLLNGNMTLNAITKGQLGLDLNGAEPDGGFTIYLGEDGLPRNYGSLVWFDPNPADNGGVPPGVHDFVSIALHELMHCLGIAAWKAENSPFSRNTIEVDGNWYYSSEQIRALLGGDLPLRPGESDDDHYGNGLLAYQPIKSGLMYDTGHYDQNRLSLGQLDLLILQDLGWEISGLSELPLVDGNDLLDQIGTNAANIIQVFGASHFVSALAGDDTIIINDTFTNGNFSVDGGLGHDIVRFNREMSDTKIAGLGNDFYVQYPDGADGVILLRNVERVMFNDKVIALDLEGRAGQAYRLYQAAFDRDPDVEGLTYWVGLMDKGMSLFDVTWNFINSAEFISIYGDNPTSEELVGEFYLNILGREGEEEGIEYWVGEIDSGTSLVHILAGFSESVENKAQVAPEIASGILLYPFDLT